MSIIDMIKKLSAHQKKMQLNYWCEIFLGRNSPKFKDKNFEGRFQSACFMGEENIRL